MPKAKKTTAKKPAQAKTFKTADFGNFSNAAKRLNISHIELCQQLGYNGTAHHRWSELKRMPKVAQLACEGLLRRHRGGAKTEVVIQADNAKVIAGNGSVHEIHPGLFVVQL